MKIGKIKKSLDGNQVKLTSMIETGEGTTELWYAVDREYEDYCTDESVDAFLLGLFIHAMKLGENIFLEAPISEKLYYNMKHNIIKLYALMHPSFQEISIHPKNLNQSAVNPHSNGIATGFSGGVDSFSLLADHYFHKDITPNYKITHLIYNNVGAHGKHAPVFFHKRYEHLKRFSEEFGLPFVKIDSNLHQIVDSSFLLSFLPRNVASVLVLQKLFAKYIFASSYKYDQLLTQPLSKDGYIYRDAYIQPLTFSYFGTESTECVLAGSEYSRIEKTLQIASLEPTYRYLYVCTDTDSGTAMNCSTCFKCARTLLTLDILGLLHHYQDVFDIQKYKNIRQGYIESLLYERGIFSNEILKLATEHNYPISPVTRFLGTKYIYPVLQGWRRNLPYGLRQNVKKVIGLK